jgi:hypothetical protein
MKRPILIAAFVLLSIPGNCQVIEGIPVDENGKVNYNEVVRVDSVNAADLYLRAKHLFVDLFKSAKNVMQGSDDDESGTIVGRAYSTMHISTGLGSYVDLPLWYTLKITCEDGRYKYELYNLYVKATTSTESLPIEEVLDKKVYYKKNGSVDPVMEEFRIEIKYAINNLTEAIKAGMIVNSKKDDW